MTPRALFDALVALRREAGTPGAREARALVSAALVSRGFAVREERFAFHPSALSAFPLLGAGLIWLVIVELPLLMLDRLPGILAPVVWAVGAAALGLFTWGLGSGVELPGAERREDANLYATSPSNAPVSRWIVAHLDTKAQGHSLAGRLVAIGVLVLAGLALSTLTVLRALGGPVPAGAAAGAAGLAVAAGVLVGRGRLKGASPGARDNGSGVLAALVAAWPGPVPGTGFLFTGAEEFGLVGARVAAASGAIAPGAEVLNLDTIADEGTLSVVAHNGPGRALAPGLAAHLADLGIPAVVRRLPPGILVDSLPLARAGARAVTIGRLGWSTLRLIHTPRDGAEGFDLAAAEGVGRRLAELPAALAGPAAD